MFTSLWNWRASLMMFNKAVNDWQIESGYNNEQLSALLEAEYKEYNNKPYEDILNKFNLK
jgi:hypothetical protein